MGDFFTGLVAGGLIILAVMHLIYQKRLTTSGWVAKTENVSKFRLSTFLYFIFAIVATLYMVYT